MARFAGVVMPAPVHEFGNMPMKSIKNMIQRHEGKQVWLRCSTGSRAKRRVLAHSANHDLTAFLSQSSDSGDF